MTQHPLRRIFTAVALAAISTPGSVVASEHGHFQIKLEKPHPDTSDVLRGAERIEMPIGQSTALVHVFDRPPRRGQPYLTYFSPHANETTSIAAGKELIENIGGRLVIVTNRAGQRLVSFKSEGRTYSFDPNRMFTWWGAKKTLERYNSRTIRDYVVDDLVTFGQRVIRELRLHTDEVPTLVALHNNTNGRYSILSYLPGGSEESAAAEVFVNDTGSGLTKDPDDFYYLTSLRHFDAFSARGLNCVLQDIASVEDDGSLSVYVGSLTTKYINAEAQKGHRTVQNGMLQEIIRYENPMTE